MILYGIESYSTVLWLKKSLIPKTYPWKEINNESYIKIVENCRKRIRNPNKNRLIYQTDYLVVARKLKELSQPVNLNSFPGAILAFGLNASYKYSEGGADMQAIEEYCTKIIDENGRFHKDISKIEECMIGFTLIDLFIATGNAKYRVASEYIYDYLKTTHPRSEDNCLPYKKDNPNQLLIDTTGMICPFLAKFGKIFNKPLATSMAVRQLTQFLKFGIDKETKIPFHAYSGMTKKGYGLLGWTRGIGWLAVGLVDTIYYLSDDVMERRELVDNFSELISQVAIYQEENGNWPWALTIPGSRIDTSGTSMIAYSIERGLELGILDIVYSKVSEKALSGILAVTNNNGEVGEAITDCQGVGHHPAFFGSAAWAQGTTAALYSLILKRSQGYLKKSINHNE